MPCPHCRRHGGQLKSQGRISEKLFAAKLLFRATGHRPRRAATTTKWEQTPAINAAANRLELGRSVTRSVVLIITARAVREPGRRARFFQQRLFERQDLDQTARDRHCGDALQVADARRAPSSA